MTLLAAAQTQTDTSGAIVTGIFTLAAGLTAGLVGLGGGFWLQRRQQRGDREAREAARQQVRDEFQRQALQELHEAALQWRHVLAHLYSGLSAAMSYSGGPTARLAFVKVLPRIRSDDVRQAAERFRDVADAAMGSSPAANQLMAGGGPDKIPAVSVPPTVDEAFKALDKTIDSELQRYL